MEIRVAVLHPIVSLWANFTPSDRSMYEPHPNKQVRFIDEAFTALCRELLQHHVDFDVLDDDAVAEAQLENGKLRLKEREYSFFLLPPMDTIRLATVRKLAGFAEAGGTVIAHAVVPKYAAEGIETDGEVAASIRRISQQPTTAISTTVEDVAKTAGKFAGANCEFDPPASNVLCTKLSLDHEAFYFLVNTSAQPWDGDCHFPSAGRVTLLHPESGECNVMEAEEVSNSSMHLRLRVEGYHSMFVRFSTV